MDKDKKAPRNNDETEPGQEIPDSIVASAIGKKLKRMYSDIENEPVPDRFKDLLKQLSEQEDSGK